MKVELSPGSFRGLLIVVEGPDGAGKTTLENGILRGLKDLGMDPFVTYQPSQWWRQDLRVQATKRGDRDLELCPEALALFSIADRVQHQAAVLEPALAEGRIVLCNRYVFSLVSHFLVTGEVDLDAYQPWFRSLLRPDLLFVLDAPTDVLLNRVTTRDGADTRQWDQQRAYVDACRQSFLALAADNDGAVLDSVESPERAVDAAMSRIISIARDKLRP